MLRSIATSRFESDALFDWYVRNERRFRRYKMPPPEGHRGRWRKARIALIGLHPVHTPRTFQPRNARDHYRRCEDWFSFRANPRTFNTPLIRQMLSWVPPFLGDPLGAPPDIHRAPAHHLRRYLDDAVVMLDVKKVPPEHSFSDAFPVTHFRRQMRALLRPEHPLRCIVVRDRRAILETVDVLDRLGGDNVRLWTGKRWAPLPDGLDSLRGMLDGRVWPQVAVSLAARPDPLIVACWHGWRSERYITAAEVAKIAP